MDYIDKTFLLGGYLSQHQSDYEVRDGQIELARQVDAVMHADKILLAEAPCGSGKGFAYAVPAINLIAKKRRTVIVTANIALQAQLIEKDLPALAEALPTKFTAALLKGRSNFICPRKIEQLEMTRSMGMFGGDASNYGLDDAHGTLLQAALAWAQITKTGDREEPCFPADAAGEDGIWHMISVGQDECIGRGCFFERQEQCWANKHRAEAIQADIIVTNYNLLFSHVRVHAKTHGKSGILPKFHCLVMDEAHEAARIARDFFGATITYGRFKRIAELMRRELKMDGVLLTDLTDTGRQLMQSIGGYAKSAEYRARKRLTKPDVIDAAQALDVLKDANKVVSAAIDEICSSPEEYHALDEDGKQLLHKARMVQRNVTDLATDIREAFCELQSDKVYWIQQDDRHQVDRRQPIRVEARHLDVAGIFRTQVYPLAGSVTLTSATLTAMGTFDLVRAELGIGEAVEFVAKSPFDFNESARLVVGGGPTLLAPVSGRRDEFNKATLPLYRQLLDLWPGRVLCLLTANSDLDWLHKQLDGYGGRTFYKQGEAPRPLLTQWFRDDEGSVLMGVDSFWTGIDVPGPKMIIIHKLPFPYPDVVLEAIKASMPMSQWFNQRYVPWMITKLRQGNGRLLRRVDDYGVVVCMDRRLTDKRAYADLIARSLPYEYCIRTDHLEALQPFIATHANAYANVKAKAVAV